MDVPAKPRIADLRREIEALKELTAIYQAQKYHTSRDIAAHERRLMRLEEIKQQLAKLLSK